MSDILDLKGRIALITGAGQGVGRAAALHFANHNAGGVIVNDFFKDRAEAVAEEVRALGCKAVPIQCDVTKLDLVKAMAAQGERELGPISILVNNAGNAGAEPTADARKPFWETTPEDWDSFIKVNFYGVINCTAAVVPGMIERKAGRITTVISDAGRMGDAGLEVYAGAKAGAAGFMRATARALGRHGIAANCVAIAATFTPPIKARLEKDPERLKKIMQSYVIRRPGEPEDVANMILYLSSDAASWITGQTYPVNGGYTFSLVSTPMTNDTPSTRILQEKRGNVLVITINRPEARNAFDQVSSQGMHDAMERLDAEDDLFIGIITGAGGHFSAGADLKAIAKGGSRSTSRGGFGLFKRPSKKPLIAAVEGYAVGGGFEICMTCDLIVAAKTAKFGLPEARNGVVAIGGGLFRLPKRIPYHLAMEFALTGEFRDADWLASHGLVNRVVEEGKALEEALKLADKIMVNSPTAVAASKEIMFMSSEWTEEEAWRNQMDVAKKALESEDRAEGLRAFAEKRKPVWKGR